MKIVIDANKSSASADEDKAYSEDKSSFLLNAMISLGYPASQPPIADFLRQLHQLAGVWVLCEPVYWEVSHDDAFLRAHGTLLGLSDKASRDLFDKTAEYLAPDGLKLHYHNAHTWLMKVDGKPKIQSVPTHLMLNQSMKTVLKELDLSLYWQKLMTELQMLLYSCPHTSALPVNGFWFYGYEPFQFDAQTRIFTNNKAWVQAFPGYLSLFYDEKDLDNQSILWLSQFDEERFHALVESTSTMDTLWLWNDIQYQKAPSTWWMRLVNIFKNNYKAYDIPKNTNENPGKRNCK